MLTFGEYSPDEVVISYGGFDIRGFAKGSFIEAERNEDTWKSESGTLGDVVRSKSLDRRGKVKLVLMAASPYNDILTAMQREDEKFGGKAKVLNIRDYNGLTFAHAEKSWIVKPPKLERAPESGNIEWNFECADLEIVNGGNVH